MTKLEQLETKIKAYEAALIKISSLNYDDKEFVNDHGEVDYMYLSKNEASENLTTAVELAEKVWREQTRFVVLERELPRVTQAQLLEDANMAAE